MSRLGVLSGWSASGVVAILALDRLFGLIEGGISNGSLVHLFKVFAFQKGSKLDRRCSHCNRGYLIRQHFGIWNSQTVLLLQA